MMNMVSQFKEGVEGPQEGRQREDHVRDQFQACGTHGRSPEIDETCEPSDGGATKKLPDNMSHFLGRCVDDLLPQTFV